MCSEKRQVRRKFFQNTVSFLWNDTRYVLHWLTNEKIFSFEPYQDITGCITINILPSFAESRQMKVCSWMLFALLATAVSVGRGQDCAVCALPSGRERQKGVFWQLFRPKKLPSRPGAIARKGVTFGLKSRAGLQGGAPP